MTEDIKGNILPYMSDKAKAAQEIYDLVIADMSISEQKKSELVMSYLCEKDEGIAEFIAAVLIFSIERKFVKHDTAALTTSTFSVDLSEYIFGAEPPLPCKHFCGRDGELSELHAIMETADKVFVSGIPGIGKSEFIKAYAKKYGKDYANILYFNYNGNLEKLITDADFYDDVSSEDDAVRFKKHNRFMRSLKSDTLIIIDNFNVTETSDTFLDVMMKYNCKIIFTTRCNFEYGHTFELKEISDMDTLIKIASYFYIDIDNHIDLVKDIIEAVHHHILSVELAARLLQYGKATPETVLEHLKSCAVDTCSDDNINLKKDGINRKAPYYTHLRTLFALYLLDDDKQNIMRCMVFAPVDGIRRKLFADWLEFSNLNAVNELVELGFISNASMDLLSLHPMIREISVADLKPSYSNCQAFVEHIHRVCLTVGAPIVCHKTVLAAAGNIMKYIVKDNIPAYLLFVEDIFGFAENYNDENVLSAVISNMNDILLDTENGTDNDRALLYIFRGYYAGRCENNLTKAISLGHKALSLRADEKSPVLAANLNMNLGVFYCDKGEIKTAAQYAKKAMELLSNANIATADVITITINYANIICQLGEFGKALKALEKCAHLAKETGSGYYAKILYDSAVVSTRFGDYAKTLRLFEQSFKEYSAFLDDNALAARKYAAALLLSQNGIAVPQKWNVDTHLE